LGRAVPGVKVLRFSVGFGRIIWSRRSGRIAPNGRCPQSRSAATSRWRTSGRATWPARTCHARSNRQSVGKRIAIVAAGPIANLVLAVLLFAGTYVVGVPGQIALLASPAVGTPAAAAGVRDRDLVTQVDGTPVQSFQDLRWRLLRASGRPDAALTVERPDGSISTRIISLSALASAEWEGDFMPLLGLTAELGAPVIDQVIEGKPAARAGLKAGDRIVAIDGVAVSSPADAANRTNAKPAAPLTFRIARDGTEFDAPLTTEAVEQAGRRVGIAGVHLRVDPATASKLAVNGSLRDRRCARARRQENLGAVRLHAQSSWTCSHRPGVAQEHQRAHYDGEFRGQSAQAGVLAFVGYLALISISLGVLNLLPVPLLDGGHLLYYFAELLKGSPVSDRAFEVGQRIGIAVLAMLMALAFFNDLSRLF
jgi:regulator of sigma E protease